MHDSVQQIRLGEFIQRALSACGLSQVFGIPGVHNLELFREPERHGLSVTVPRHEQGAGFMADAYFRATGTPAVCALITGPGVLNALTPISQAWHDSIPILVIASTLGENELGVHGGALHDTPNLVDTLRPYTCVSTTVRSAKEFISALNRAMDNWCNERPRPAYIDVPRDLLEESFPFTPQDLPSTTWEARVAARSSRNSCDPSVVDELLAARAPMIVAGGGATRDGVGLLGLAERLGAPIVLTGNAKAAIRADHPLNLGATVGSPVVKRLLEKSDLVIALGTELSPVEYLNTGEAPAKMERVLRVDIDARTISRSEPGSAHMKCGDWLSDVVAELDRRSGLGSTVPVSGSDSSPDSASIAREELAQLRRADPFSDWVTAVERAVTSDTIFTLDSAQLAYQSHQLLNITGKQKWMAPYGLGTLGPALPMAIGAAVAAPDSPVVAIAGDGGCLFTLTELATAKDLDRQVTLVVWDNTGYKEIENSFRAQGIAPVGVVTSAENLSLIARGFGACVHEVGSPDELEQKLGEAISRPELTVIRVIAPDEMRVSAA